MPPTKDWTSLLKRPCTTKYFEGGEASDWCEHTPPDWARVVSIRNQGEGALWVSVPGLTGAWAETDDAVKLQPNESQPFYLSAGGKPDGLTFSTRGEDGADHPMDLTFELAL
jgi:hypothetical protein